MGPGVRRGHVPVDRVREQGLFEQVEKLHRRAVCPKLPVEAPEILKARVDQWPTARFPCLNGAESDMHPLGDVFLGSPGPDTDCRQNSTGDPPRQLVRTGSKCSAAHVRPFGARRPRESALAVSPATP